MLSERFDDALVLASDAHRRQVRKATGVPYVSHLLAVTAIVLEAGGDEDTAIAALLHDAVEDTDVTIDHVRARFGDTVAAIVAACTDTDESPKPPWRPRKEAFVARLDAAPAAAVLVTAADKLHNVRTMVAELHAPGPAMWSRFHAGPDEQLWYHRAVADVVARRAPGALADELRAAVDELAGAIAASAPAS